MTGASVPATSLGGVSILDDARPGMNPDIRPQDDLFGHVNGRWLDETEIPSDRSSWGPFVQPADVAEQQVRDIITSLAETPADQLDEEARKIGDLYASFMDEEAIDRLGTRPIQPLVNAVEGLRDVRDLAAFLGEFERIGGAGLSQAPDGKFGHRIVSQAASVNGSRPASRVTGSSEGNERGATPATFCAIAAMCAGVEPQQRHLRCTRGRRAGPRVTVHVVRGHGGAPACARSVVTRRFSSSA